MLDEGHSLANGGKAPRLVLPSLQHPMDPWVLSQRKPVTLLKYYEQAKYLYQSVELFQILKDDAMAKGLEKVSFHSNTKERQCQRKALPKNVQTTANCPHFTCYQGNAQNTSSQASTECETKFPDAQLDLEKAEKPEIKLPTWVGSSKKQESFRKTSTSALLTRPKLLTVWITTNCGKF